MDDLKNMDWGNLPFGYFKTDYNVRSYLITTYAVIFVMGSGESLK